MNTIEKLTEIFKEFPGIGERQAKRFVYFLMSKNGDYSENLCALIEELKKDTAQCSECFRFFISLAGKESLCEICRDKNIDPSILMVIEKDSDLESINKSQVYNGKYFILGGLVPIVEKNTNKRVRINELIKKIQNTKEIKEIILAFSLNPQGNHTDFYIRNQLRDIAKSSNIKISSLGRGLSTGTELEYSDNDTLKNALKNRQ
ncbi:MAG: Recombination protein RecR [Parcubacteria group bacterium GW2011_GWF2_38_8]|nr:MAG: Recombination protein RecR [Parcubacteria group bacterium GW2011_GWF2_38_8]